MMMRDDGAAAVLTDGARLAFLLTETTTIVTHRRTTVVLLDTGGQCHFQGVDMARVIAQTSSRTDTEAGRCIDGGYPSVYDGSAAAGPNVALIRDQVMETSTDSTTADLFAAGGVTGTGGGMECTTTMTTHGMAAPTTIGDAGSVRSSGGWVGWGAGKMVTAFFLLFFALTYVTTCMPAAVGTCNLAACIELDTPAPVFNPPQLDLAGTKAAPPLPLDASDLPTELSQAAPPPTANMAVEVGRGRIDTLTDSLQPARPTRAEATKNSATSAAGQIDQVCRRGGRGDRARPSGEMYRTTASSSPPPLTTTTPKQAVRISPALVVDDVARTLSHPDGTAKMAATTAEQRDKVRPHALLPTRAPEDRTLSDLRLWYVY